MNDYDDITFEEADANPETFYWALIAQGLKWIDQFAEEHSAFPDKLHNTLLNQFQLVGMPGHQRVVRFRKVRTDSGELVEVPIDLLEQARRTSRNPDAAVRSVFAYVRMRVSYAARAEARKQARRAELLAESYRDQIRQGPSSNEPPPAEAAEHAEEIAAVRSAAGKDNYGLILERYGRGTSVRAISRSSGMTRYRVHQRCDQAIAAAVSAINPEH